MDSLDNILETLYKETSGTGGGTVAGSNTAGGTGEQTFTPVKVKKPKKEVKDVEPKLAAGKVKDNYAVSHFGFTPAPSKANRLSKAIDYKELWEVERDQKVKIISGNYAGNIAVVHDFDSEKDIASGEDWVDVLIGDKKEKKTLKASELKPLSENYAQFRNETSKRNAPEQLHKAVKTIKQKITELDKLLEYTQRLRSEITEGSEDFKYMKHTERALEQIQEMIKHIYIKNKKLK